jgi:hypothetical protein
LEILLLTMIAPIARSARRVLPTMTGAPGKAFFVKTAAKSGEGRSSAISVSVIFAGFGASRGMNSNRVAPTRNPAGSAACFASQARWALRSENVSEVLDTEARSGVSTPRSEAKIFCVAINYCRNGGVGWAITIPILKTTCELPAEFKNHSRG